MGAAINTERNVTHNELRIKGRNPNLPDSGFHSLENKSSTMDCSLNNKNDLMVNPMNKMKGIVITRIKQHFIQKDDTSSRIFRLALKRAIVSDFITY